MSPVAVAATAVDRTPPTDLDHVSAPRVLAGLDCFLFDCDGVLWRGSSLVPGAAETLQALRQQGKRVLFVTNNASKSRDGYVSKFESMGLDVRADEIVSASYAAAAYLRSVGFGASSPRKVLVLGYHGVEEELDTAGIPWVGGTAWAPPPVVTGDEMIALRLDADIGAVLCSWDPFFNYARLVYASACLRELPGCLFVVTNPDDADTLGPPLFAPQPGEPLPTQEAPHTRDGGETRPSNAAVPRADRRMMPGTGCMSAALAAASGATPVVVGKGGPWLVPFLLEAFNLDPTRTAMVGDRLDTDIAMGLAAGLQTVLTLTGVSTREQALSAEPASAPHYIVPSVAVLAGLQT